MAEERKSFWFILSFEWRHVIQETRKWLLKQAGEQKLKLNEEHLDRALVNFMTELQAVIQTAQYKKTHINYNTPIRQSDDEMFEEFLRRLKRK